MTTSAQLVDTRIETYLGRLNAALAGVAPAQKDEIVREISAHIMDTAAGTADRDGAIDRVLRLLGTPEELAERYSTECLLARAGSSFSPWLLLRTCWRWAKLGVKGTLAFLLALTGYGTALAFTVSVFLKPFVPGVGLWLGPHSFHVGVQNPDEMRELLGSWFVPVMAVAAFVVAIGTTRALRWMIRRRSPTPAY
jgi:uncharacterized membrane protein